MVSCEYPLIHQRWWSLVVKYWFDFTGADIDPLLGSIVVSGCRLFSPVIAWIALSRISKKSLFVATGIVSVFGMASGESKNAKSSFAQQCKLQTANTANFTWRGCAYPASGLSGFSVSPRGVQSKQITWRTIPRLHFDTRVDARVRVSRKRGIMVTSVPCPFLLPLNLNSLFPLQLRKLWNTQRLDHGSHWPILSLLRSFCASPFFPSSLLKCLERPGGPPARVLTCTPIIRQMWLMDARGW